MITKIDIKKFGVFNEFAWKNAIGGDIYFKLINIIYGRNYSGKTTLSRMFRCIEKGEMHQHYHGSNFSILLNDGRSINQDNIGHFLDSIKIRVYNTDFVKDNLSWLHNPDGTINPFALLGSKNIEIDEKIKDIEKKLGNDDEKKGLIYLLSESIKKYNNHKQLIEKKEKNLDEKLRAKAKEIKDNAVLYNEPTYQITSIKKDIPKALSTNILSIDIVDEKKSLLKEEPKDNIQKLPESKPKLSEFYSQTNKLLTKEIKPSQPITDLIDDALLQEWVRQGIDQHKGKRSVCGFCGNPISNELWGKLDAHFSEESKLLRQEIDKQIGSLKNAKQGVNNYGIPSKESFYVSQHARYGELVSSWQKLKASYSESLAHLIEELQSRDKDIFNLKKSIEFYDISEDIIALFKEFNQLIDLHNKKNATLATDQKNARIDLRLSEIASFLNTIDYQCEQNEIEKLKKELGELEKNKINNQQEVNVLIEEKRSLETQANDESKGAELVNQHLARFFSHDGLKLVAEGTAPVTKFKVVREGTDANNLSEGECSLIAFCYFMAKIEDEINNHDLIIYIDDPISSLDSNHVFFMFSLIESIIAKPKKYSQLFISTHNLDFLKYIKRITVPTSPNSNRKKDNIAHFLIERNQKQNSARSMLTLMPDHIKNYTTEFNYLFGQIYSSCKEEQGDKQTRLKNTYNQFYNLPNNIRKFLECYLFFKYPNNDDPLVNLDKLFDGHTPSLINRIINEHSHLTHLDRGWKPMDINEIEDCAKLVIEKIKEKDTEQFQALVDSLD